MVYQLFIPPVVSIANNGDFGKVSGRFSIGFPQAFEAKYAPVKFQHDARYYWASLFRSSEHLLACAAIGLSAILSKSGDFDIRFIGAIHAALLLLAIYLLLPVLAHFFRRGAQIAILVAIAALLCDVMYVCYFNSFYMDAAVIAFLPLAIAFFLRAALWRRAADLAGLTVCLGLLAGAKAQHAILAIPVVVLLIAWRRRFSPVIAWFASAAVLMAAAFTFISVPPEYHHNSWYDVIFLGILPISPAPAGDLAEFGLEPSDVDYSNTSAYSPAAGLARPEFTRRFDAHISATSLMRFYARHPARTVDLLVHQLDDAGSTRPFLGNFDAAEGLPPYTQSQAFALWSGLRRSLFAGHGLRYLLVTIALPLLLFWRAANGWRTAALALGMAILLEFAVTGLADAADGPRHFTVFAMLEDISLLFLLATLLPRSAKSL